MLDGPIHPASLMLLQLCMLMLLHMHLEMLGIVLFGKVRVIVLLGIVIGNMLKAIFCSRN